MSKQAYIEPRIERVPLIPEEAVLSACKCVAPQVSGPPAGWCSGEFQMSCSAVGS